jgi:hypothetical protein
MGHTTNASLDRLGAPSRTGAVLVFRLVLRFALPLPRGSYYCA